MDGGGGVTYTTIHCLIPEITLGITAALIYAVGAFSGSRSNTAWLAIAGLAVAAGGLLMLVWQGPPADSPGPVTYDVFGNLIRCLVVLIGLLFVALSIRMQTPVTPPEVIGSLLLVFCGLMLVAMTRELILMFLGLELISIPTYLLLFLGRPNDQSQEATLKYFFLSILSSAMLVYGFSFLYGITGSTRLDEIFARLQAAPASAAPLSFLAPLALVLVVAALAFKIAAVPFHFYAPDVYQGTTNFNAGLLAVIPKIAGIVALVRIGAAVTPSLSTIGWQLCLTLALLTMTIGNVIALWQQNIRRLMAYSSIAHAGYMLIGPAVWFAGAGTATAESAADGIAATLLYLTVYAAATIGTFAVLIYLGQEGREIDTVDDLAGSSRTHRGAALALAIFMFSLTGIPPLAGFWGKLLLLTGALAVDNTQLTFGGLSVRWWFVCLAVVGVVNVAISAAYYLRIVAAIYFRPPVGAPCPGRRGGGALVMSCCAILTLGIGLYPGPLTTASQAAATAFLRSSLPSTANVGKHADQTFSAVAADSD